MISPARVAAIFAAALLSGCGVLGFEEDDRRNAPPPGLFPESDFGDGAFADPEPEPSDGFDSAPSFFEENPPVFADTPSPQSAGSGFGQSAFAEFDSSEAPPPLDYGLLDRAAPTQPTYTPPPASADPRAHAAYLGFVPARGDAESYFDWLWSQHAALLDGATPYVTNAPDTTSGTPAVHIYTVNVTAGQAKALCDALAVTQTPCTAIAR